MTGAKSLWMNSWNASCNASVYLCFLWWHVTQATQPLAPRRLTGSSAWAPETPPSSTSNRWEPSPPSSTHLLLLSPHYLSPSPPTSDVLPPAKACRTLNGIFWKHWTISLDRLRLSREFNTRIKTFFRKGFIALGCCSSNQSCFGLHLLWHAIEHYTST